MICDVKVKGKRMKALIDTGAGISMLSSVVFTQLPYKEAVQRIT